MTNQIKVAIRRELGVEPGKPARLHLICGCCGSTVDMGMSMTPVLEDAECQTCGQTYNASGWILSHGNPKAVR